MQGFDDSDLMRRLKRLEQSNRGLKWALPLVLLGAVGLTAAARREDKFNVVTAQEFVLRADDNMTLASLVAAPGGPRLNFYDTKGHSRGVISSSAEGGIILSLADDAMHSRAELAVRPDGRPDLTFFNKKGVQLFTLGEEENGQIFMGLSDSDGVHRIGMGMNPDKTPTLNLYDAKRVRRGTFLVADGHGVLSLEGPDGKHRAVLQTDPDGTPSLRLLDKDGNSLFTAPPP